MKPGEVSCGQCGYHLKLKRRMSLGTALRKISETETTSTGASLKRVGQIEENCREGRKNAFRMILVLAVVFVILGLVFAMNFHLLVAPPPLASLVDRSNVPPLGENLRSIHPYYAGRTVSMVIPLDKLFVQDVNLPELTGTPEHDWSRFAHALELPYFAAPNPILDRYARSVIREITPLRSAFSLSAVESGSVKLPQVMVLRGNENPDAPNYLQGALLDLGKDYLATMQVLLDAKDRLHLHREQMRRRAASLQDDAPPPPGQHVPTNILVNATLTFIPVSRATLDAKSGDWGWALEKQIPFLLPHDVPFPEAKGKEGAIWYFCPVLIIRNHSFTERSHPGHFPE